MSGGSDSNRRAGPATLRWQSQAVLLAFVPVVAIGVTLTAGQLWDADARAVWLCAGISLGFVALVWLVHAATPGGAITGGFIAAALFLCTPGWHTALWPLFTLVTVTFAATRFGRARKETLGLAEDTRGRRASQVAANLGVAGLAALPAGGAFAFAGSAPLIMMLAALAEAAADTISSELGQVLGGEPRLVTTLQPVPAGTDGAVTWVGTLAGCAAAAAVVATGQAALLLTRKEALIALCAAIGGLFFDSLLGALPERRGWLNNDAVNALSTLFAAVVAGLLCR